MNWINKVTPPGLKTMMSKKDTPDDLWVKCPASGELIYRNDLEQSWYVTPAGAHLRISPRMRFRILFDDERWEPISLPQVPLDPLKFKDDKPYPARLKAAKAKILNRDIKETEDGGAPLLQEDCMVAAYGKIGGVPAVVLVQDFEFMGGSLGMAAGEAFITAAQLALARKSAFVVCTASGGARMQEGTLSLMQMPRTTLAINDLADAKLPYVVVLTDPTSGGVSASYAMLGDVHIAEPGAMIAFSGPRVIEQTIRESLPKGFQRSEFLREKGQVDIVVDRRKLKATVARVLGHLLPMSRRRDDRSTLQLTPPKTHAPKPPEPKVKPD
ncbi:acetyl-CoA carboxylase, carboxyl transferase, beta subunit [Hyphomonas neptunium ATCC 15444]|uniref:Acetyl-coenzyme A carboxylase carboxyl transferase subunit beta n=2 Tax=Hyphomonas TaxID=85 RepID=ACCD_HYPNA|nr:MULTISPECIES: acetyl-CoA carboxylase carboxyl transferase subunit beta [Hyphomonas]Q0BWJ8.1 RecName: Full=Acetyl-coenzyme A carboxylase carboxyl transferase subunit beta; Short=ACCase subunit beta; Short=Acetyl-CoA carboxylase carboxyltransferase subunit beta [Hyphomonas neptunium ATCC 15444]ABI75588.1 acetyl-CoA carboxylase, carboxyl transferase, beta subunit [Hyphomonas neptunium ATCC 15444]KCZ94721.1 acetyl-CoA carboxylase carboxyl transferase subunit beta [Hyphomonas hirschiana VP5]